MEYIEALPIGYRSTEEDENYVYMQVQVTSDVSETWKYFVPTSSFDKKISHERRNLMQYVIKIIRDCNHLLTTDTSTYELLLTKQSVMGLWRSPNPTKFQHYMPYYKYIVL